MIGGDVCHFVRQNCCNLGGVIGQRQQAAGHIEIATGQGKGVDRRRIEHCDAIGLARILRYQRQRADDAGHQPFGLGVSKFTTKAGDDARVLICADPRAGIGCAGFFGGLR